MSAYSEKFKDPRWQKIRLNILERDEWSCQKCTETEKTLHIHHRYYIKNREPWEYPMDALVTLCKDCHKEEGRIRPGIEQSLLFALREKFFAEEISEIAIGFKSICTTNIPLEIVARAISSSISDEYILQLMVEAYWKEETICNLQKEIEELKEGKTSEE